jgi:twitching motility two-component system response regulator PilH
MLRQNNFVTSGAADAETGIEAALRDVPDLIFLDIVLPGMSGFNALRQLRREPATKAVPIIMISGNVQATEQFYVQRIGADDFMRKPFGRSDVFSRVQRLVESGRLPSHAAPRAELLIDDDTIALPDPVDAAAPDGEPHALGAPPG